MTLTVHELDDTTQSLRDALRAFADAEIAPLAARIDRDDALPRALWPKLGRLGVLGITAEEDFGGAGLGYLQHVIAAEEISRASGSVGIAYIAHSNLHVNQLRLNGNEAQKALYLPPLIRGEHVGALAMSEAGAGSDVVSMTLRAERRGDRFVLNGTKLWITNGAYADRFIVYAKTDAAAGKAGISAFIVERGFAGFATASPLDKLGMRGSGTCELVFTDCEVPAVNLLGELNRGVRVLMSGLDYERIVAAGGALGIMQAAFDLALPYTRQRRQFGQPIGDFQLVQGKLADLYARLAASRALLYATARAADNGRLRREDAATAILFVAEAATASALDAIQLLGGNGYVNDNAAGRLLRDAKLYEIGAGTSEIRRMLIGRELAGRAGG
ncbi:MAG: acyl-CoA dehydrogenase family protein [Ideonella sp.]|nr:acyl-CoA dehydrogenase family protein [Ideonella sp.]MCC7458286.1 acyl-CoA dehydrogenase family protein [Nitrospira sp.]